MNSLQELIRTDAGCRAVAARVTWGGAQPAELAEVAAWRDSLAEALREELSASWNLYHATLKYILNRGLAAPLGDHAASLHESAESKITELEANIDRLRTASPYDLIASFRHQRRGAA